MLQGWSSRALSALGAGGVVLLTSGCLTGLNVGQDGSGGSTSSSGAGAGAPGTGTTTSASSGGGAMPTGATCTSPGALRCPWGKIGGPCGSALPAAKDCDSGYVCEGGSDDTPGTCIVAGQPLIGPGEACGAGVLGTLMCPWDYACNAPITPDGKGICVPRNCVLDDGSPVVSAASITIDGDGPTQHYDFSCDYQWDSTLTGEANAYATNLADPSKEWLSVQGCQSADGDPFGGSIFLSGPLTTVGTVSGGQARYDTAGVTSATEDFTNFGDATTPPMTFTVTQIDDAVVRGSYDVIVTGSGTSDTRHLTGTFEVCRLPYHTGP